MAIQRNNTRRQRSKTMKGLMERSKTIYPGAKPMRPITKIRGIAWRARDRIAMRKRAPPKVFSNYKQFYKTFIDRARHELQAKKGRGPVIVLVGGIAGGGKTTITKRLKYVCERLQPGKHLKVQTISLDSYFKPRAKMKVKRFGREREVSRIGVKEVKPGVFSGGHVIDGEFDNPKASDLKRARQEITALKQGKSIKTRQRDVSTGKMETQQINGSNIDFLIVEGLYPLHAPLAQLGDVNIGVQATLGQQFLTRSTRDIQERKRQPIPTARKFAERAPYQRAFVVPTLRNADIILDVEKTGIKPSRGWRSEYSVWVDDPKKEGSAINVFLDEIGLDHARNKWREQVKKRRNSADFLLSKKTPVGKICNDLLTSPRDNIRIGCAEALKTKKYRKELKKQDLPRVKGALSEGLSKDPSWRVRARCAESLAHVFGMEVVPELARALERNGMHQLGVGTALRYLGLFDLAKNPTKELKKHLKDKNINLNKIVENAWHYFLEHPRENMPPSYRKTFEDWGYIDYY